MTRKVRKLTIVSILLIPLIALATQITSIPGYTFPEDFLQALHEVVGEDGINSLCRTPAHNRRVGGAKNSLHQQCLAADIKLSTSKAKRNALIARGFCPQHHGDHWHVVRCADDNSRKVARNGARARAGKIRERNGRSYQQSSSYNPRKKNARKSGKKRAYASSAPTENWNPFVWDHQP